MYMQGLNFRRFLVPFLTAFLLLLVNGIMMARMDDRPFLYQGVSDVRIPPFRTKDLQGNIVTQDIFAGKFTVVCFWMARDADNSRKLLKSIQDWRNSAQVNIQLVGMVGDLRNMSDEAQASSALSVSNEIPAVPQILVNDELASLLVRIRNAPTVFFVDGQGNLVGQPVVGNEPILVQKEAMRLIKAESDEGKLQKEIQNSLFFRP